VRMLPHGMREQIRRTRALFRVHRISDDDIALSKKTFSEDFLHRNRILERLRDPKQAEPYISAVDPARGERVDLDWLAHGQVGYDRIASHFGLANRDVWCDLDLLRFYLSVPTAHRARGAWTKALVRDYLDRYLPPSVTRRSDKTHVGWAFFNVLEHSSVRIDPAYESINARRNMGFALIRDNLDDTLLDALRSMSSTLWPEDSLECMHRVGLLLTALRFVGRSAFHPELRRAI
jgi:Asparagine synthase